ncbi:hypothetical protein JGI10_00001, partial [Candidatus Kryptonium thompsonii]
PLRCSLRFSHIFSLVPVVVTKRKYVRKPKGAPEGSVIVEREEVIMVEPKLPFEEIE